MDKQVQDILNEFHERMRTERVQRAANPSLRDPLSRDQLMRAIGPQSGWFLNHLVKSLQAPTVLELGTSFGYSTIWLAEAARASGGCVITMEMYDYKSEHAKQMAQRAGLAEVVDFRVGDVLELIEQLRRKVDVVLLDVWKDMYKPCLEAFYPLLNPGAYVIADNMLRPGGASIESYGRAVRAKPDMSSVQLPIGSGLEVSRYEPTPIYG